MAEREPNPFVEKYWPLLLAGCGGLILWYTWGDNGFAGAAGFMGVGWLVWEKLLKTRL